MVMQSHGNGRRFVLQNTTASIHRGGLRLQICSIVRQTIHNNFFFCLSNMLNGENKYYDQHFLLQPAALNVQENPTGFTVVSFCRTGPRNSALLLRLQTIQVSFPLPSAHTSTGIGQRPINIQAPCSAPPPTMLLEGRGKKQNSTLCNTEQP